MHTHIHAYIHTCQFIFFFFSLVIFPRFVQVVFFLAIFFYIHTSFFGFCFPPFFLITFFSEFFLIIPRPFDWVSILLPNSHAN